jgi:hypothetical protein
MCSLTCQLHVGSALGRSARPSDHQPLPAMHAPIRRRARHQPQFRSYRQNERSVAHNPISEERRYAAWPMPRAGETGPSCREPFTVVHHGGDENQREDVGSTSSRPILSAWLREQMNASWFTRLCRLESYFFAFVGQQTRSLNSHRLSDRVSTNTFEGGRWVKILHTHRSPPCAMPPLLRESLSLPADTDREATRALHAPCHLPSASELLRE